MSLLAQLLAWSGLLDLTLLEYVRAGLAPGCGVGSACVEVTSGPYGRVLGVPWTWLGMSYFAAMALSLPVWPRAARALAPAGLLVSAGLIVLQVAVIGRLCPFCLVSAGLSVGLAGTLWRPLPAVSLRQLLLRTLVSLALLGLGARAIYRDHVRLDPPTPEVSQGVKAWRGQGPVRFVLFMDLQCLHCSEALHELLQLPPAEASLAVRFYPSDCPEGPGCRAAAACYGASDFWTALLEAERLIGGNRTPAVAPEVLQKWLDAGDRQALEADRELAVRLGLLRIPVLYVNDRRVHGPLSAATLRGLLNSGRRR